MKTTDTIKLPLHTVGTIIFNSILFLILSICLSCSNETAGPLKEVHVLVKSKRPKTDLDPKNLSQPIHLDIAIEFDFSKLPQHAFLIYRVVSKIKVDKNIKEIQQVSKKHDLLYFEILEQGLLEKLEAVGANPSYKTLDFNYAYTLNEHELNTYKAYSSKRPINRIADKEGIINIDFVECNGFDMETKISTRIIHDIGLIVYEVPLSRKEIAEAEASFLGHTFDYENLFRSTYYQTCLLTADRRSQEYNNLEAIQQYVK